MKIHELKIKLEYYTDILSGGKTFEIRKNDRDFEKGDNVVLRPLDPFTNEIIKHYPPIVREIRYITTYEQKDGYVVFSI